MKLIKCIVNDFFQSMEVTDLVVTCEDFEVQAPKWDEEALEEDVNVEELIVDVDAAPLGSFILECNGENVGEGIHMGKGVVSELTKDLQ